MSGSVAAPTSIIDAVVPKTVKAANELTPPVIPKVSLSTALARVDESSGTLSFDIKLSSPTSLYVSYNLVIEALDANNAADARVASGTYNRTIRAGLAGETFTLPIVVNTLRENSITVKATLTGLLNGVPAVSYTHLTLPTNREV